MNFLCSIQWKLLLLCLCNVWKSTVRLYTFNYTSTQWNALDKQEFNPQQHCWLLIMPTHRMPTGYPIFTFFKCVQRTYSTENTDYIQLTMLEVRGFLIKPSKFEICILQSKIVDIRLNLANHFESITTELISLILKCLARIRWA